jgi:hypothetical protein
MPDDQPLAEAWEAAALDWAEWAQSPPPGNLHERLKR